MLKTALNLFFLFSRKERIAFIAAFFVLIISSLLLLISIIKTNTVLSPVDGGEYVEGIVGQPIYINPIFAENNNPDNDLSQLFFANMRAIAEKVEMGEDGRTFTIRLKGDIAWQDNQPLTADDIIFTLQLIQDPDVGSSLAAAWKGVQINRISERELQIIAPTTYSFFENTLLSLQPIPKHLFESIPPANIRLSDYNREPIGSGPYKFDSFEKRRDGFITQITAKKNDKYFGNHAYIETLIVRFYQNEPDAVEALNDGDIDGMAIIDPKNFDGVSIPSRIHKLEMPRYYAVFPNSFANPILTPMSMRTALDLAIDKVAITQEIFGENAVMITDPIPPFTPETQGVQEYSPEKASAILEEYGWRMTDSGIREKDGERLEFILTVYPTPFLEQTAEILKKQWKVVGIDVQVHIASAHNFNSEVIKPRNYELLLFGNNYGKNLDPYSFWHSSQKLAPGLNLSVYSNKDVDKFIDVVRTDFDPASRAIGMGQIEPVIMEDKPAVFLYSPYYLYVSNKSLKGFDVPSIGTPSERFTLIDTWYIKTVRTFKK
ncbi:MAG: Extracellular solute-binding protein [Candidatus Wolfebacteria bacterium GW2011_GWC2_46_275]|uniref:Extracellular solute-binding protein n=2 Tax=Candidatus Wolfeibacteriota TaxID=1752735 RepID=A0A0G1U5K8_9BACT|nr:MAG: putative Extracellular solute-binding protein family 5 [Candidatus Wolfebacteria bacterium GW2011_GWB1_47_1]KKU35546.1 MAG: Extracellular solute-binding protein [Candidatus Wolfebacteria bacterium GW2011_GWC2_46_275]KKU41944.1 MAG: Extracellular solute-binding protein [Candidatus Wolfebacteria bacterium GW2011_GWB2_46_69]KKU54520.1 MAG: Extracellular solute-binding protein [Candidatus Wolfebacteria bacterium GW2011_GWC1_47_103]KKU59847.1 MAG: Extracellular solute-binding protein [Candid